MKKVFTWRAAVLVLASMLLILSAWVPAAAATVTMYVNVATGVNDLDHGNSASRPVKTIKYALNRVPGDALIKIAAGTYNENLLIDKNKITLQGAGRTTTFIKGATTAPTIQLFSAQLVYVKGLCIRSGEMGIAAGLSTFVVQSCTVENSAGVGIEVGSNSGTQITGCQVRKNAYDGISGNGNASVRLDGSSSISSNGGFGVTLTRNTSGSLDKCTVSSNGLNGVNIANNSCADLNGCTIKSNQREGVWVTANSSANLWGNTISANQQSGVDVNMSSSAFLHGGNVISLNGDPSKPEAWRVGLGIHFSSMVNIIPAPSTARDKIISNNGAGIFMGGLCGLQISQGLIDSNLGDGIVMMFTSSAQFSTGGVLPEDVDITRNGGYGIKCRDQAHDSKYAGTPNFGSASAGTLNKLGASDCQTYY